MRTSIVSTLLVGLLATLGGAACSSGESESADSTVQATGPAGIEFVTVPVPGQDCDSIVLKGTRRFQGRAYVLPQAYVGVDALGKPLFQVVPNADGSYAVRLGMFFPGGRGDEQRADNNRRIRKDCGYDRIREVVNANAPEAERIGDPSPLLVNHIKATMAGFEGEAMIGHTGTDILSYVGQDAVVEFKLTNEATLRDFIVRLRSNIGVQLNLDFVFSAQTSDKLEATVDLRSASDALDAALGADLPLDGLLIAADFKARLARVIQTMNIDIFVDSSNDAFTQAANRIVEKMILDNPALTITPPALPPGLPAENGAAPAGAADAPAPAAPAIKIDVRAALQALRARGTYSVKIESTAQAAQRTYSSHTVIRANFTEPGVTELSLYSDDTGSIFTDDIVKGMAIYLVPSSRVTEDIEYSYRTTTFRAKDELFAAAHNMGSRFPRLAQYAGSVNYPGDEDAFMYDGYTVNLFNWSFYTWGFQTLTSDFHNRQFHRLDPNEITRMNNVGINFSRVGRPYTFAQLADEHDLWEATLEGDKNRVRLVAKSNLGRLKLENRDVMATVDHVAGDARTKLYERRYFEDNWSSFGNFKSRRVVNVGAARQMPAQRSAVYVKVIPERGDVGSVNGSGIRVGDHEPGSILHPPANQQQRPPSP